jgi:hypothetical protein
MAWTSPRTWVAGEEVTASLLNTHVRDNFNALGGSPGTYTPTYTNMGSPTTNDAVYVEAGKWITGAVRFTLNGAPTGIMTVSLPFTAAASMGTGRHVVIGEMVGLRTGVAYEPAFVTLATTTTVNFGTVASAMNQWNATVPQTWASTDVFRFTFAYRAA